MKYFYIFITFLCFNFSFGQTEVLGDWYLYSINVSNMDNYNQEIGIDYPNLRFITDNGTSSFEGAVCNGYGGVCVINASTIEINDLAQLLGPCESDSIEQFEQSYFYEVLTDLPATFPSVLDYQITGIGLDQTLLITNSTNSNYAVFGRQSQPTDVLGDWYLYSTTVNGLHLYNAEFGLDQPRIDFTDEHGYAGLLYDGLSCNGILGEYLFNTDGTVTKIDFSTTLEFCDDNNTDDFKTSYELDVLGAAVETTFSYQVTGTGDEQTMVLINTNNSNYATFGRTQQTPNIIGQWYLYNMIIDGNLINNPSGSTPDIFFTTDPGDLLGLRLHGSGPCNSFQSDYYFNPQQTFNAEFIQATLSLCYNTEEELFENYYFYQALSTTNGNTELDYEITGTGDDATLIVTNLSNGNQAFYGRQALSIEENEFTLLKISLNCNPVLNSLDISSNQNIINSNYDVFSITGQRILNGILNSNSINVNQLHSGLYFLKVFKNNNVFETVRFIKN